MWWQLLLPFLKTFIDRVIPDPVQKAEAELELKKLALAAEEAEAKAEAARAEEFARFYEATQPPADRVYIWANTLIALIRPAMAVFTLIAPFAWPREWAGFIGTVGSNAPWSIFALSPLIIWVGGRDVLRLALGIQSIRRNGGEVPQEVMPPGVPAPAPKPKPPVVKKPDYITPELQKELDRIRRELGREP